MRTVIVPLPAHLRGIVHLPEVVEQRLERDHGGIVVDPDDLGVARALGGDVFVSGVRFLAAGVATDDGFYAGDDFIGGFSAPETPAPEDERGGFRSRISSVSHGRDGNKECG